MSLLILEVITVQKIEGGCKENMHNCTSSVLYHLNSSKQKQKILIFFNKVDPFFEWQKHIIY